MKLETANPNYCATVVQVKTLVPLEGCDNLVGMPLFGLQAIVGKETKIGDMGILFPAEAQLSPEFTRLNSLYRHKEQNANPEAVGYLEDNRRVRAIKLRGHRSDALFMPLTSIGYCLSSTADFMRLKEGDTFDSLEGNLICQKYHIRTKLPCDQQKKQVEKRVDEKLFPEHFDSMQWLRVDRTYHDEEILIVTQKVHGTSIRIGNVPVNRKLTLLERIARKLGVKIQATEFAMVYGSRKVIKDANNPNQQHFYDEDLWTAEGQKLDGLIPENYIVYGELIGWTASGSPIQKHYTYDCLPGTRRLYVYRVSFVNAQGTVADLSWDALVEFCATLGLAPVPELWRGRKRNFKPERWVDTNFRQDGFAHAVGLSLDSPCDEGVCIRIEGQIPEILKLKSPVFLHHETKMLDEEAVDIEETQETVQEEEEAILV